jgi:predicted nucleotide-binding protein (sugar kinase/HSP70/actin superfamily)
MKSLKSNGIYHNVADLIDWGKYALYEDILPALQSESKFSSLHITKNGRKRKKANLPKRICPIAKTISQCFKASKTCLILQ